MNRSLRNLALLGLLVLGASTAGAQNNLLFNVTYNPTTKVAQFTSTGAATSWSESPSSLNVTAGAGIYFENFFKSPPPGNGELIPISGVSGGILATSQTSNTSVLNEVWDGNMNALNVARISNINIAQNEGFDLTLQKSVTTLTTSTGSTTNFTINFGSAFPTSAMYASQAEFQGFGPLNNLGAVTVLVGSTYQVGTYSYSVVPEPSTYAAIAGALGLAYAVYRRRRQAAAATA
jgi:hypothetical protein